MAERRLRVRILLNKGKRGISLHRLPKLLGDIQGFLDSLSEDTVGRTGDWTGLDFRSTNSVEYTAESIEVTEEARVKDFDDCLRGVIRSRPDPKIRRSTLQHYSKISEPLTEDTVSFGIGSNLEPGVPSSSETIDWLDFDKATAKTLAGAGQSFVRSVGSIQGMMQSLFLEKPHFYLKELSTGKRILCQYDESKHHEVVEGLERPRAVVHVYGMIFTDIVEREITRVEVSRIVVARHLAITDLGSFIGSAPAMGDADALQAFIDESRGRGQA